MLICYRRGGQRGAAGTGSAGPAGTQPGALRPPASNAARGGAPRLWRPSGAPLLPSDGGRRGHRDPAQGHRLPLILITFFRDIKSVNSFLVGCFQLGPVVSQRLKIKCNIVIIAPINAIMLF